MDTNRAKQTARKSTGGKAPPSKRGILSSPGGSPVVVQHHKSMRRHEHASQSPELIYPNDGVPSRRDGEKGASHKTPTKPVGVAALGSSRQKGGGPSAQADNRMKDFMWSAPTSNVRGGAEEEDEDEDMLPAPPPALVFIPPAPIDDGVPSMEVIQANRIPKCDRCSLLRSNPVCEPSSQSKKCAKCFRDHRNCSWITDAPRLPLPENNVPPKKRKFKRMDDMGPGKQGNLSMPALATNSERTSPEKSSGSAPVTPHGGRSRQQIGPRCVRCASFTNNPICERSSNPNDSKCKKCRRDKQSCSFAPFSRPPGRRKSQSKLVAEDDANTGDKEEKEKTVEGEKTQETGDEMDVEVDIAQQTEVNDNEKEKGKPTTNGKSNESSNETPMRTTKEAESNPLEKKEKKKRKQDAGPDDSIDAGDRSLLKKRMRQLAGDRIKKRMLVTPASADRSVPLPSGSKTKQAIPDVAKNPESIPESRPLPKDKVPPRPKSQPQKKPVPLTNGIGSVSAPLPAGARVISLPQAAQQGVDTSHTHESNGTSEPRAATLSLPPSQIDQVSEVQGGKDRPLAVIEQELIAAEFKAQSHRSIAESYLRDAERADQEVARLKDELLTAVRRRGTGNLTAEGSERRKLIELLGGEHEA